MLYYYGSDGAAFWLLRLIFVIVRQAFVSMVAIAARFSRDNKNSSTILY